MVRRGSTVRVRQRASRKCLQIRLLSCPDGKLVSRAGTRGLLLTFPRRRSRALDSACSSGSEPRLTPSGTTECHPSLPPRRARRLRLEHPTLLDHLGTSSVDNEIEDYAGAATMTTPSTTTMRCRRRADPSEQLGARRAARRGATPHRTSRPEGVGQRAHRETQRRARSSSSRTSSSRPRPSDLPASNSGPAAPASAGSSSGWAGSQRRS
jgi:hypothetical protein